MSDYVKCKWCGKSFEKGGLNKFKSSWSLGLAGKEVYCSSKCESEANVISNTESNSSIYPGLNQSQSSESKKGILTRMSESVDAENERKEAKLESKIESISEINFGNDLNEIANVLNQLVAMNSSKPDIKVRDAIYEKMEFGIMKLRALGDDSQADFFQLKNKKIHWVTRFLNS